MTPNPPTPQDTSLEAKYGITTPLKLTTNSREIKAWLIAELSTPRSKWSDPKITSEPSLATIDAPKIPRDNITAVTLDPIRRTLGYIFEKCGRVDLGEWLSDRISTDNFRSIPDGGVGLESILYKTPEGPIQKLAFATYIWRKTGLNDDNPTHVTKVTFTTHHEHSVVMDRLAIELAENVIFPALFPQPGLEQTPDKGKGRNADRKIRVIGDQGGGEGGEIRFPRRDLVI